MTTTINIWSHTEAMTWTATSQRHQSNDEVTPQEYNVTTSSVLLAPDVTPSQWQLVRFLVIVVTSLLTNLVVVVTIKRSPRLQSTVYFYLSSLAIMDILDSLVVMPVAFARSLLNEFTIFSGWCQCWQTVLFGLAAGTLVHIIIATGHCYLMLGTPLRYHKYSQSIHAILQVSVGWVIPALLSIPAIVVLVKKHLPAETIPGWECAPADVGYMSAALVPMYYVPILLAVPLLVLLALKVKRQGHMSDQLQCVLPGLSYSNGHVHPITEEKEKGLCSKKSTDKKSTAKNSAKRRFKKPVTNVESNCTLASEYSQGTNDDASSISDAASQDDDDDDSLGKDKDMLIADVHTSDLDANQIDNTQDAPNEDDTQSPSPITSVYENAGSNDTSSHYDNAGTSVISSDYENAGTSSSNSDYENAGSSVISSDYENADSSVANSDYEKVGSSSISSDYEYAGSGAVNCDYENAGSAISSDYENDGSSKPSEADSDANSCQIQVKSKSGKEQLNEPLDDMDIHLTLETVELLNKECAPAGSDNPAYSQDESETPLADSIQVKHKESSEDLAEDNNDGHSQGSSGGGSEPGECGIKGPRRSILRRDGSRRVSKKVQFAIPENQSNEGKSANRIRRRPTGLRRRTRNSNVVNALNNGTVKHVSNGTVSMITNGVTTVPPSTFEYMIQVHRSQGLKLSRKVRSQQAHFTVLCAMLLVNGILSLPYMFSYTIMTICQSCRNVLPSNVATAFEWMHHASSAVSLLLYLLFNAEFRESLANLCGCK